MPQHELANLYARLPSGGFASIGIAPERTARHEHLSEVGQHRASGGEYRIQLVRRRDAKRIRRKLHPDHRNLARVVSRISEPLRHDVPSGITRLVPFIRSAATASRDQRRDPASSSHETPEGVKFLPGVRHADHDHDGAAIGRRKDFRPGLDSGLLVENRGLILTLPVESITGRQRFESFPIRIRIRWRGGTVRYRITCCADQFPLHHDRVRPQCVGSSGRAGGNGKADEEKYGGSRQARQDHLLRRWDVEAPLRPGEARSHSSCRRGASIVSHAPGPLKAGEAGQIPASLPTLCPRTAQTEDHRLPKAVSAQLMWAERALYVRFGRRVTVLAVPPGHARRVLRLAFFEGLPPREMRHTPEPPHYGPAT